MKSEADQFKIIIPIDVKPYPDQYENTIARILAHKFQSDITFVARGTLRTPDVQVARTGELWEIKNIRGNGKNTIEDNLRKAAKRLPPSSKDHRNIDKYRYLCYNGR